MGARLYRVSPSLYPSRLYSRRHVVFSTLHLFYLHFPGYEDKTFLHAGATYHNYGGFEFLEKIHILTVTPCFKAQQCGVFLKQCTNGFTGTSPH